MDVLLKADIFFFITAVAVAVLTALFGVFLFYAIKTLRNIEGISEDAKHIADTVKKESDEAAADFSEFRTDIKKQGGPLIYLLGVFNKIFNKKSRRNNKK